MVLSGSYREKNVMIFFLQLSFKLIIQNTAEIRVNRGTVTIFFVLDIFTFPVYNS